MNAPQIISLGCRMNIAESERMRAMLAGESDLVVVNSCAVTAEALRQTRQAIRRARRDHPTARLVVTGCAAEIDRAEIGAMSEVDGLIANAAKLDPRAWNVPGDAPPLAPTRTRAFVAVQNGCDHTCTFCVIPQGRGASRSLTVAEVLRDIEAHCAEGAREVVLTGVDLTSWGHDLPGAPRLGALVEAILAACPDLPRLRLSSVDGIEIDPLLFDLLANEARVMPHLHLSLQHGADLILKRMKRRHSHADAVELVARLKALRPDIAVGADLIAGFPTEDEAHHQANLSIIDELDIVHAHIFPFSPRPGTPAARMPQLSRDVVKARAASLRARAAQRRAVWLAGLVGETLPVLAERGGTGYAPNYAPVALPHGIAPGTIVDVTPSAVREGLLA
ncbi:tRNA (N(6)-L-threonylcarbamoyladenosine(37)-C(2))-methylthiotransferase MtaB [Porphyrobacter sp. HT-58-2]|uniref:MiaB/RimO family radical SAM methylthiotransferase n=1 Tax=Porphyrobacter sp. HT-58-2 TaxID=2023229 RepID=UPI000CDC1035|nr:MiaB/RimO family radical SAM methylthiotransferase [Porphyrobacter sp. HT-58-2]AUX69539.1 tRNA (N(6)-L-threonylcarbamoyladenosine(37)-C(2))-methylthiotransferase MtaB [Porphyrobacter sp. HT-58-2]